MNDPAQFWAAKSTDVKSSQAAAHTAEINSARAVPSMGGILSNGRQPTLQPKTSINHYAATTNGFKKSCWADSDDGEDFLVYSELSSRVKKLEKTMSAAESRIAGLTTLVQEKEARIFEVEIALGNHKQRFAELRSIYDASTTEVALLKQENDDNSLQVQKLLAEVNEKDCYIATLKTKTDEYCTTIAELNGNDGVTRIPSNDPVSSAKTILRSTAKIEVHHTDTTLPGFINPDAQTTAEVIPIPPSAAEIEVQHTGTILPGRINPVAHTTAEAVPSSVSILGINSAKTMATEATEIAGPALNLSEFPVFATPETIKRVSPPPPAPKLKMAIDSTKFGKKPLGRSVASDKKLEVAKQEAVKDGSSPEIDPTLDIRTMCRKKRVLFAMGRKVQVKMGNTNLATLPMFVLMQTSHKAFKHFTERPDATTFVLPVDSVDEIAVKAHLEWMKEMTYQGRVYSITLNAEEKFDYKNLEICRAARVLGLNSMYVGHFTKFFCDRIRSSSVSYELLDKIAALAYPENDPLYNCLATHLAKRCTRNNVKESVELQVLLENHSDLEAKIRKIVERMHKKQESAGSVKNPGGVQGDKKV